VTRRRSSHLADQSSPVIELFIALNQTVPADRIKVILI